MESQGYLNEEPCHCLACDVLMKDDDGIVPLAHAAQGRVHIIHDVHVRDPHRPELSQQFRGVRRHAPDEKGGQHHVARRGG